jgi:hypothetical protein
MLIKEYLSEKIGLGGFGWVLASAKADASRTTTLQPPEIADTEP